MKSSALVYICKGTPRRHVCHPLYGIQKQELNIQQIKLFQLPTASIHFILSSFGVHRLPGPSTKFHLSCYHMGAMTQLNIYHWVN